MSRSRCKTLPVIAIDGPAAAGKGTLARSLAARMGYAHLDSGLLYRAVAADMIARGDDPENPQAAIAVARALGSDKMGNYQPGDIDLTGAHLRDDAVADVASKIAVIPGVRTALLDHQRMFAQAPRLRTGDPAPGSVIDGRDIGSVVFPDAAAKFYVTASAEVRAQRRLKELQQRGVGGIQSRVLYEMRRRDDRDRVRSDAPLVCCSDAFRIETTDLDSEAVLRVALSHLAGLGLGAGP